MCWYDVKPEAMRSKFYKHICLLINVGCQDVSRCGRFSPLFETLVRSTSRIRSDRRPHRATDRRRRF